MATKKGPQRPLNSANKRWQKMCQIRLSPYEYCEYPGTYSLFAGRCPCRCFSAISIIHIHRHNTTTANRNRNRTQIQIQIQWGEKKVQTNKRQHLQYGQNVRKKTTKKCKNFTYAGWWLEDRGVEKSVAPQSCINYTISRTGRAEEFCH